MKQDSTEAIFWLKVRFLEDEPVWPTNPKDIKVAIEKSRTIPLVNSIYSFRISPIFPLIERFEELDLNLNSIHFFHLYDPFSQLGKIKLKGSIELKENTWLSIGLCSIILINANDILLTEFQELVQNDPIAKEYWEISEGTLVKSKPEIPNKTQYNPNDFKIVDYSFTYKNERDIIDEFVANIGLIIPKIAQYYPSKLNLFKELIIHINELITELNYIANPEKLDILETLDEYTLDDLRTDELLKEEITQQNIDKILQVNSSLSYVATQSLSGAVPILERRSLIRRHSLLGIGSAIVGLNNIAGFIENAFSVLSIEDIIFEKFENAKPLEGLEGLPFYYDRNNWERGNIDKFIETKNKRTLYPKLPYFSARLGFRETEYSIAAATQTISIGACPEWSLYTLTHELLHGHVRNIITMLFQGDVSINVESKYENFEKRFHSLIEGKKIRNESQLDSLRALILSYCVVAYTSGSISREVKNLDESKIDSKPPNNEQENKNNSGEEMTSINPKRKVYSLMGDALWRQFENEYRNINEILVHILDLNYFYRNINIYIPFIWKSWASLPYIKGDKRQYVLRSLLSISSELKGLPHSRFNISIDLLKKILDIHKSQELNMPIIHIVREYLNDTDEINKLFYPFQASLILVDMAKDLLLSKKVEGLLFKDRFVSWTDIKEEYEEKYEYKLTTELSDEFVTSPIAYLLDRMLKRFKSYSNKNIERETVINFLACNSTKIPI